MSIKHSSYSLASILSFVLFMLIVGQVIEAKAKTYNISGIETNLQGSSLLMVLQGDNAPAFTQYELFSPPRLVIDIADAELADSVDTTNILPDNDFASLSLTFLRDKSPQITRLEITLAESHTYKVERVENNLAIQFYPKDQSETVSTSSNKINVLQDIVVEKSEEKTVLRFEANEPIDDFRDKTITGRGADLPDSMFIDINNIDASKLNREISIGTKVDKIRIATRGSGVRIVLDSATKELFPYSIQTIQNGLVITVDETNTIESGLTGKSVEVSKEVAKPDSTLEALLDSSEAAINNSDKVEPTTKLTVAEELQDSFGFSGYKAKRISVDFYKIDLHNVFRLFRQISDINLIVDEAVSGSLTLALNDVPWDFALDIILNLKDLKKEERHNTIVIYPAKSEFNWPDNANDNLTFEADVEVIEQEALIIRQSVNQPAEIMQAKELLRRGGIEEQNNDIEDAIVMYEQALALWPNNDKISNKLASLYLVELGNNTKAVHFAKESLKINKENYQAALYAAIASANMDKVSEAMNYFAMSINGTPPLKEALLSYAAFSEEKNQPEAALKLLDRYAEVYSDTIDTMISRARIYDSMGLSSKATEQYKTLLYSGYQLVPGLKQYIRDRLTLNNN